MSVGTPRPMFPAYLPSTMKSWPRWATKAFCLTLTTRLGPPRRRFHARGGCAVPPYPQPRAENTAALRQFCRAHRAIQPQYPHAFYCRGGQARPRCLPPACAMLGLPPEQVVCVGDQLFRDICGANRAGLDSILVDFIRLPRRDALWQKACAGKSHPLVLPP